MPIASVGPCSGDQSWSSTSTVRGAPVAGSVIVVVIRRASQNWQAPLMSG
jgi:hypothetical protein